MFIKPITIPNRKNKKRYTYYRLCESYRIGDKVRHRNILNLGTLKDLPDRKDHKLLADYIEAIVYKKSFLIEPDIPEKIKRLARHYASIIINDHLLDLPHKEKSTYTPDYDEIDINSIEHEEARDAGAEWLCKQILHRLELDKYLETLGWEDKWIRIGMIYIIARLLYPASDHDTENWLHDNTALCELFDIAPHKISRHHLYRVSHMFYKDKDNIETYLSKKVSQLFGLDDKIILYDLTNTYFEGEKENSEKAKRGRSKEKRSDCKLMALAMITDIYGFPRYSKIYPGNIKDEKTLNEVIHDLDNHNPFIKEHKRIIVMDRGIATEENLKLLRDGKQYDYVVVCRARMNEIEVMNIENQGVELQDTKGNRIWAMWVKEAEDNILYVKSFKKQLKEESMKEAFSRRFEEALEGIKNSISRKGGTKRLQKVYERIGRLKERYPSIWRYYDIKIKHEKDIVTDILWEKTEDAHPKEGVYLIRTTLSGEDEKTVWKIYNTIREIEAAFRTLKTELKIRPVFHQKDIYSESHIFGGIMAYTVVNTIRHNLKAHGIHDSWSNIVRTMSTQKLVTTTMETRKGKTVYLKRFTKPIQKVQQIYHVLGLEDRAFWQKKSVFTKMEKTNSQPPDTA